jgi:hypothetical protein
VFTSPHSVVLEIPMALGAVGTGVAVFVGIATILRLRVGRPKTPGAANGPPVPYLAAALGGVLLMTLVNPVPISAAVTVVILAGLLWASPTGFVRETRDKVRG